MADGPYLTISATTGAVGTIVGYVAVIDPNGIHGVNQAQIFDCGFSEICKYVSTVYCVKNIAIHKTKKR